MKLDQEFVARLRAFIGEPQSMLGRARWIVCRQISLYVRIRQRRVGEPSNRITRYTLEIGNVVIDPDFQGLGLFAELLDIYDEYFNLGFTLYVENVMMEEHYPIYLKRGYVKDWDFDVDDMAVASFYKAPI